MATQQTFNYRSLAGCIKAIKDSFYYGELDNPEQIEYISFEIPLELVKLDRNQTVILDNLNSNPYIIDRSYKEVKAIAKNISHAFNFFVKYPGQEKLEVSWCWDFNAMHIIYCEEEREKRFQEFMTAKKAKQVEQVTEQKQQLTDQLILEWNSMKSNFKREDLTDDCGNAGIDVRLQKIDGDISLHIGDCQHDSNHYGEWACGTLDYDWEEQELEANINDLVECLLYELKNN